MIANSILTQLTDGIGSFSVTAEVKRLWAAYQRHNAESAMARQIASELALYSNDELLDMGYGRDDLAALAREAARMHMDQAAKAARS